MPLHPELCSSFHLKVFGEPMSLHPLPQDFDERPRKPKARTLPSLESLSSKAPSTMEPPIRIPAPRAPSRAPSESGSNREGDKSIPLRRSVSRNSEPLDPASYPQPRSRSLSIDKSASTFLPPPAKKALIRAPSGKDLFRGREVGLIRRTSSVIARKERASINQTQSGETHRMGLLGRKSSDGTKSTRDHDGGLSSVIAAQNK
jgi:hypothetical protein